MEQDPRRRLEDPKTYGNTSLECDVVMKGGITSGVVYPLAVCELATVYTLRNIGGTSAGAIAAAVTAAAELGRRQGKGKHFGQLASLPSVLANDLLELFQPAAGNRKLFNTLLTGVKHRKGAFPKARGRLSVAFWLLWTTLTCRFFWLPLLAAAPGVALLVFQPMAPWARGFVGAATLVFLLVGAAGAFLKLLSFRLPRSFYGLVTGSGKPRGKVLPLTDWLHRQLNALAAKDPDGAPLTFGDLWRAPLPEGQNPKDERSIHLEVITTCLSLSRSFRLPDDFAAKPEEPLRCFFFHPDELRRLFPEAVVKHLEHHPPPPPRSKVAAEEWHRLCTLMAPLKPLPAPEDLPVIVAVRMSLAFPVLIGAVPLYQVDETRLANDAAWEAQRAWLRSQRSAESAGQTAVMDPPAEVPVAEPCWFSDGGIASNFPIHIFDSLLPKRPTFGINLRPFHPDREVQEDQQENLWMARDNQQGYSDWWFRQADGSGIASLGSFLGAIKGAMQNWADNEMLRIPGYRDRLVHIYHTPKEGGMNLDMPQEVITALSERGRLAGTRLVEYFTTEEVPQPGDDARQRRRVSWRNHRWVRLRSALAMLEETCGELVDGYSDVDPMSGESYADLLKKYRKAPSYKITGKQQALARRVLEGADTVEPGLLGAARAWRATLEADPNCSQRRKAPSPISQLRVTPAGERKPVR
jgi:predicted acylesterase/phospholipase RssA